MYLAYIQLQISSSCILTKTACSAMKLRHVNLYSRNCNFLHCFSVDFPFYGYCCTELEQKRLALISKPLQEQLLTVELCEENRSIIVRNIVKKLYSHEALDMYFSMPAVSGGEAVEAITMMGSDTALITFKDPQGWIVVYIV